METRITIDKACYAQKETQKNHSRKLPQLLL